MLNHCPHSDSGWCLKCVKHLHSKLATARTLLAIIAPLGTNGWLDYSVARLRLAGEHANAEQLTALGNQIREFLSDHPEKKD